MKTALFHLKNHPFVSFRDRQIVFVLFLFSFCFLIVFLCFFIGLAFKKITLKENKNQESARASQSQPEPARASQSQPEPARAGRCQPEPARANQTHLELLIQAS